MNTKKGLSRYNNNFKIKFNMTSFQIPFATLETTCWSKILFQKAKKDSINLT